LYSAVDPCR